MNQAQYDELLPFIGLGTIESIEPCGSRVTCDPPPADTDEDFLVKVKSDDKSVSEIVNNLIELGYQWEGGEHYQMAAETFMSWRRDKINLIVTRSPVFATRHRAATSVCKRLNLQNKADRIALFQAVLYGIDVDSIAAREKF
jgi:hypothetical protein